MKRKLFALAAALSVCMLCGCANEILELSDEQMEEVANYSAGVLLKYDASSRSRLVDDKAIEEYDRRQAKLEELKRLWEERNQAEESIQEEQQEGQGTQEEVIPEKTYDTFEDFFVFPEGCHVAFSGYRLDESYEDSLGITVDVSSPDKLLLIVNLTLINQSGADQYLDIFGYNASYKFRVTGSTSQTRGILTTMMMDDFATYQGVVPADGAVPLVLITEMDRTILSTMTELELKIKNTQKDCTISLL